MGSYVMMTPIFETRNCSWSFGQFWELGLKTTTHWPTVHFSCREN